AGLAVAVVEEAELDPLGVLGEDREVRALAVPGGAEREGTPGPERPHQACSSTLFRSRSATSVAPPRRIVSTFPFAETSSSRGSSRRSASSRRYRSSGGFGSSLDASKVAGDCGSGTSPRNEPKSANSRLRP